MLKSFIRFTETDIDPLADNSCESESFACDIPIYEYPIPALVADVIKWQMNESEIDTSLYDITDFKIGIVSCGNLVAENVGSIVEAGDGLLQLTATIPDIEEGCYNFILYIDYTPVDCSLYVGSTVDDLIADGLLFGDTLLCIPVPDWL